MSRLQKQLLCLSFTMFCITSCKDCYYIENDLHGMWQIVSIEKYSTREIKESQGRLYYFFQRTMVKLGNKHSDIPESMINYIAHFEFVASDSIKMGDFRKSTTGEGDYVNKEGKVSLESLYKFGLYQDYTIFHVQHSSRQLILTSDSACIILRKY